MKVAIVVKQPSKFNFEKAFGMPLDVYHLCSDASIKRVLKKDVDININVQDYDFVILCGSEAVKQFTKVTSVTDYSGRQVESKDASYKNFIVSISPAALSFKPEIKPVFDDTVNKIYALLRGDKSTQLENTILPIRDTNQAISLLKQIKAEHLLQSDPVLAFDTETSSLYARKGYVLGISLSHTDTFGTYIDSDCFDDECVKLLQEIINDSRVAVVGHNVRFDIHMTNYHFNLDFTKAFSENRMHDTMLLHYVLDERQGHGLKALAMKYTDLGDYDAGLDEFKKDYCKNHGIKEEDFTYDLIPWDIISNYGSLDTISTIRLFYKFWPIVQKNDKLLSLYTNILMPATQFLQEVEDNGVPLSLPRLLKAREVLTNEILENTQKLYQFASVREFEKAENKIFNPGSPVQLRTLLFDYEKLQPTGKLTGTGAISTDAEVLETLAEKSPLAIALLNLRKSKKLLSTYVEKMIQHIDVDGRLRTGFSLHTTTSGRLSSSGTLNLQQLPRDNPLIKGCIKPRAGYRIVAGDASTSEVYYAAVISGDTKMQDIFRSIHTDPENSPDYHSLTAHTVFPVNCEAKEVKKKAAHWRQASKGIIFSVLYGSGAQSLAEYINKSLMEVWVANGFKKADEPVWFDKEDAQKILDDYFRKFPLLKKWIDSVHKQIKDYGFVYSPFGRKRRLHNHKSSDKGVVSGELRSGLNAVVQGASSDALLLGAMLLNKKIKELGLDAKIIALVHDSVVAEVAEKDVEQYSALFLVCMQTDFGVCIPGVPMGFSFDSEEGGSEDYSCGKLKKAYPEIAAL